MNGILIRKATADDLILIHELARKIWYQHYPGIISTEQIAYMLQQGYSLEALQQQMKQGHQFYLMSSEAQPLGYAAVSLNPDGTMFLHKLYTDTHSSLSGLGQMVFNHLLQEHSCRMVRLRVNKNNERAIRFYLKNDFRISSEDDLEIGEGFVMEDYLMEKMVTP